MTDRLATGSWGTHRVIAVLASVVILIFSLVFAERNSTYRWAFVFLLPIVWGVYALREKLVLSPGHFGVFVGAILLHNLGAFGAYDKSFLFFRFDSYVHFFFGFVAALIIYRSIGFHWKLRRRSLWWLVPLLILGMGGVHELFECFTTIILGPERGMVKLRPGEPFDTQKDLMNNLLGAILGVAISREGELKLKLQQRDNLKVELQRNEKH